MHATSPLDRLHAQLRETYSELFDAFVDPAEALCDDGERWNVLSTGSIHRDTLAACGLADEQQLADIRRQCRALAVENEFAINGHENRVSYLVGPGHAYRACVKKGCAAANGSTASTTDLAHQTQQFLEEFLTENHWHARQQEIVRRRDRDGEAFLRLFTAADGTTRVRFIEPDQIATPPSRGSDPASRFGILTEPGDVETPRGFFVDGTLLPAAEVQHRKANVDFNCRRGLPLFYPVRKNLRRAEKLLRNMSVVAEIQSAIALIRKHRHGTLGGVQQFVVDNAAANFTSPSTGRTQSFRRYGPGTILDAAAGVEYDFPAAGIDAGNLVRVLQAELRAIAARLVMPEFMLTSDASNANYASTMVAEGPALRMFARLQAELARDDVALLWRVVDNGIAAGALPVEARRQIEIIATPPSLAVRDPLQETHRRKLEHAAGVLSLQTWSQLAGLDYEQEQANRAAHGKSHNEPRA